MSHREQHRQGLAKRVSSVHFQIHFQIDFGMVGVLKSLDLLVIGNKRGATAEAKIAQLGERMTEDHKVRCSIHLLGAFFSIGSSKTCIP